MTRHRHTCHDRLERLTLPAVVVKVGGQGSGLELLEERPLAMLQVGWQGAIRTTEHILKHMVMMAGGFVDQMSMQQLGLQVAILVRDQIQAQRILHHGTRVQVLGRRAGDELDTFENKTCPLGSFIAQLLYSQDCALEN